MTHQKETNQNLSTKQTDTPKQSGHSQSKHPSIIQDIVNIYISRD
ncbi:hypothetical protein [Fodinisporobacter ferrooxydans]